MAVVFLSSSFIELREYRDAAFQAIEGLGHQCILMERFPAADQQIRDFCADKIGACDVVVLIIGQLYGTLIPNRDISFSENEFDIAMALKKPILVFFPESNRVVTNVAAALEGSQISNVPEDRWRRGAFLRKVLQGRLGRSYNSPEDLKFCVSQSVHDYSSRPIATPSVAKYSGKMRVRVFLCHSCN